MELGIIALAISKELNEMSKRVEEMFDKRDIEGASIYLNYLKQGNEILKDIKKR